VQQKWPLKAAPEQMKSTKKITTNLSEEETAKRDQKKNLDGPGQSSKKTPQDLDPEGQQTKGPTTTEE
jgi:hypothetical protein